MQTILIIEDEKEIINVLKEVLEEQEYNVEVAYDGIDGFYAFANKDIDLVVTDIMMPKLNGISLIEMIRKKSSLVPIIALTAMSSEEKVLEILSIGADDVISKPFSIPVLIKKIDRLLKKTSLINNGVCSEYQVDDFLRFNKRYLDDETKCYIGNGDPVHLTSKEFQILKVLFNNMNRVITRKEIADILWDGAKGYNIRNVDNHIRNIRKKIPSLNIQTHSKEGYRVVL